MFQTLGPYPILSGILLGYDRNSATFESVIKRAVLIYIDLNGTGNLKKSF